MTEWQQAVVIKASFGGYDGKSQWRWHPGDDVQALVSQAGQQPGIIEAMIPFSCEGVDCWRTGTRRSNYLLPLG